MQREQPVNVQLSLTNFYDFVEMSSWQETLCCCYFNSKTKTLGGLLSDMHNSATTFKAQYF